MWCLGSRKKVLRRWMTLQADRKRKEERRETPALCNSCKRWHQDHCTSLDGMNVFNCEGVCVCVSVNVSDLDDKEECWRRVEGPVVESDDGGTTWAEQVSYLKERHFNLFKHFVCMWVYLGLSLLFCIYLSVNLHNMCSYWITCLNMRLCWKSVVFISSWS